MYPNLKTPCSTNRCVCARPPLHVHAGITLQIPDFQVEANRHRRPVRNDRYTGARKV